ncbi:MAG: hypothetical protein ACOYEF_04100 [Planifilum sp.]|jgi:hypothetical protein
MDEPVFIHAPYLRSQSIRRKESGKVTFHLDGRMEMPPCSSLGENEGTGKKPEKTQVFPLSISDWVKDSLIEHGGQR